MDKRIIKAAIIKHRNDGRSFSEISELLEKEYCVTMSRQSVYAMFKRATSEENINKNLQVLYNTKDIVNYNILGYKAVEIRDILLRYNVELSVSTIQRVIDDSIANNYMEDIFDQKIRMITSLIHDGEDIVTIKDRLSYKEIEPKISAIKILLREYVSREIKASNTRIIASVMNILDDDYFIKQLLNEHELKSTLKEIHKSLNN